jgi:glycine cleavage system regulatory protein
LLGYLSESYDNVMNIRHAGVDDGTVKIIVPADLMDEVMEMLNLLKDEIDLEVVRYEPNPGHP